MKKTYYAIYAIYKPYEFYKSWFTSDSKREVKEKIGAQSHHCYLTTIKTNKKGTKGSWSSEYIH